MTAAVNQCHPHDTQDAWRRSSAPWRVRDTRELRFVCVCVCTYSTAMAHAHGCLIYYHHIRSQKRSHISYQIP